jgi:hypothetical protein
MLSSHRRCSIGKALGVALGVCFMALLPRPAAAAPIVFDLDVQFSNATMPGGPAPWLRATIDDTTVTAGFDVRMTFETIGLTGSEFVSDWYFNIAPAINPATFGWSGVNIAASSPIVINHSTDCCNADGGGLYDLRFSFPTAAGPGRFTGGETVVIDVNWAGGTLTPGDFLYLATPQGGNGPFASAAHIQGIGAAASLSTFVGADITQAPEPGLLLMLGGGLAALAARRRTRRSS